jgi:hypothetical protein
MIIMCARAHGQKSQTTRFGYESSLTTRRLRILVSSELDNKECTSHTVNLILVVTYPETYPDVIPELAFESIDEDEGELTEEESERVVGALNAIVSSLELSMGVC